jgi:glycosyltransferase involved in cell wall biosynthesis
VISPPQIPPFRFAYVGRFVEEQKRFRETVEALVRATREIPGTEAVLYGDGPERPFLEERLLSTDASAVSWGGSLAPHEIPARLQEAHAIVLLSDYEGTPTALMEGMAAGCVPVCTRIRSGIPELISDGVNGILVDDRGDSFLAAIRRLHDDPRLRERLALAARRRIEEDYALDVCADRWVEFLDELHTASGPKRAVRLPRFLRLPKPLSGFAHQDIRTSPTRDRMRRGYVKARMWAGKVRRKVAG